VGNRSTWAGTIGFVTLGIINASVGVVALVLSGLALWRQRALPRMEGQLVHDGSGYAAVAIRHSGSSSAKAPWFLIATGSHSAIGHAGPGFLGVDQGRYVVTDIPEGEIQTDAVRGVVGCKDAAGGT
jgi:hypothetical protein